MHPVSDDLSRRALGSYLGLAIGDALGATVEFLTPAEIRVRHGLHRDLLGGGWLHLRPGDVTDDTQMSLALGEAILARPAGWDLRLVADSFLSWLHARPVDVGQTCRRGLRRYQMEGSLEAPPSEDHGGNGAAMRNLPVVLATLGSPTELRRWTLEQAHVTHHHPLADAGVLMLAELTRNLILGDGIEAALRYVHAWIRGFPVFRFRPWPGRTTGYIVDTVQTVLEAFARSDNFEDCVVRAVNRGGDADTIGALAGQLAGALYGAEAIPERWLRRLNPAIHTAIAMQTAALLARPESRVEERWPVVPDASTRPGNALRPSLAPGVSPTGRSLFAT